MRARSAGIALVFGVGLAVGVGMNLTGREPVAPAFAVQQPATTFQPVAGEQVVMGVARRVSPAVVSVSHARGSGSGFFIRRDGVLLTNWHVVQPNAVVQVALADGRQLRGEVLGGDPNLDVAVVRVPLEDAPVIPLADSDELQVGQLAIAIGNPLGLERTLTTGVVSAVNRSPRGLQFGGLIQTDAAINQGNSGGPLLDSQGRVVGINSVILSPTGTSIGLGFAIPINLASDVAQQLLTTGRVTYAILGVEPGTDIYPELSRQLGIPVQAGVMVGGVAEGTPAAQAGIRRFDIITQIGDVPVSSGGDLRRILRERRPGETVAVALVRPPDGRRQTVQVRLAAQELPGIRRQ